jgi:hypothetical protein
LDRAAVTLLSTLCLLAADRAWAGDWEEIVYEKGIRVFKREIAGSSLVEFRGTGRVAAPMIKIAAVLRNSGREKEWMENCADSHVVRWRSPTHAVVYHRTASPAFFISDRDMVVEATTTVVPRQHKIRIDFHDVQDRGTPPIDDAVRVPRIVGHWDLVRVDENTTEIEYQVHADPGGSIPHWIVNWAAERLPFHTIDRLREQVKKDGYDLDISILEQAIDWDAIASGRSPDELGATERHARAESAQKSNGPEARY